MTQTSEPSTDVGRRARSRRDPFDPDSTALLVAAAEALSRHSSELASFVRSQQVNRVLFSGIVVLGTDGTFTFETGFVVPFAAVVAYNHHLTDPLYVTSQQSIGTPPTTTLGASGVGFQQAAIQRVDAKTSRQFPLTGTQLSIIGTASTVVSLSVHSSAQTAYVGT